MSIHLSRHGARLSRLTGVRAIMEDIRNSQMATPEAPWINLSAGNPVVLPEIEALWRDETRALMDAGQFGEIVCRYGESQGLPALIHAVVDLFNERYGWDITPDNVLVTAGSQSLLFAAANCFCGQDAEGRLRRLLLPVSPDYTGYDGMCLTQEALVSAPPEIEIVEPHVFRYRVAFDRLCVDESVGALVFSRPTNPSGNVVRDEEVQRLVALAQRRNVPVFIDAAYGPPIPDLAAQPIAPVRGDNVVYCMSLSKAGLPGERVGIGVGPQRWLEPVRAFLTNVILNSSRFGQALAARAIRSGALARVCQDVIAPYYRQRFERVHRLLSQHLPAVDWHLHRHEGGLFAWLWLKNLPVDDRTLYEAIKRERVFVVPGSYFFAGIDDGWKHKHECLRISLTASEEALDRGIAAIARAVARVYGDSVPVAS